MKMFRLLTGLATIAIALAMGSGVQAGVVVMTASGGIGGVELDNLGISGGTATIEIERVPNLFSFVNTVNGNTIVPQDPVTVQGPITLLVTQTAPEQYSLALSPATYTEAIGVTPATQSIMAFNMKTGVAPAVLPNFFNMSGNITSLLSNNNPTYDYSMFAKGGDLNLTFTGTTFSPGISSFADLFTHVGSSVVANGSFSQSAVPEPSPLVLMAIGIGVVFSVTVLGKRFKRPLTAG